MSCIGCQRCETEHVVTLADGRVVCNTCEDWRHECEVRDVVTRFYPDGEAVKAHLAEVRKRRGNESAKVLRDAVFAEWVVRRDAKAFADSMEAGAKK